ncbi:unnamed protein product [Arctogadus glacialis]
MTAETRGPLEGGDLTGSPSSFLRPRLDVLRDQFRDRINTLLSIVTGSPEQQRQGTNDVTSQWISGGM